VSPSTLNPPALLKRLARNDFSQAPGQGDSAWLLPFTGERALSLDKSLPKNVPGPEKLVPDLLTIAPVAAPLPGRPRLFP
jgi:hypothetical protein